MAAPRTLLRSSRLISSRICTTAYATRPACRCSRIAPNQRLFSSSSRVWEEIISTPSRGDEVPLTSFTKSPSGSQARTIILRNVPKRAVLSDIKKFFQSEGIQATNFQLTVDRFTFHNNGLCFVELSSEEEAQKALKVLHETKSEKSEWKAAPVKKDFVWGSYPGTNKTGEGVSRFFVDEGTNASEALRPLIEGRRKLFAVQPPGWGPEQSSAGHNKKARQVVQDHFGKYGIETISKMEPFFGDKLSHPRMLCFIDFTTKDGADQAAENHDPEIEGRKVWLSPVVMAPWRAHQVGKVDAALLAELQEKGLASKETYEDKFGKSDRKYGAENYNTTRTQRELKKRKAEKA